MQLKRDTEFALRILYCIVETQEQNENEQVCVTIGDLVAKSGIPRIVVERICGYLDANHIIRKEKKKNGDIYFTVEEGFFNQSVLNILEATEHGCRLLAVFDKRTDFYHSCEPKLEEMQKEVSSGLSGITIADIFGIKKTVKHSVAPTVC